jgi:hypothetical protein
MRVTGTSARRNARYMPRGNWTSISSELERAIHLTVGHSDPVGYLDADSTLLPEFE